MAKFKVGDKVRAINKTTGSYSLEKAIKYDNGTEPVGIILSIYNNTNNFFEVKFDGGSIWSFNESDLILLSEVNNNKTNMSLISKIKLFKKGEPEKSNIKAGLRTVDDEFTSEGKEAFLEFLYQKNKDAFKAEVADPINAEAETK